LALLVAQARADVSAPVAGARGRDPLRTRWPRRLPCRFDQLTIDSNRSVELEWIGPEVTPVRAAVQVWPETTIPLDEHFPAGRLDRVRIRSHKGERDLWLRLSLRCAGDPRKTTLTWNVTSSSEPQLESVPAENLPVYPADDPMRAPAAIARALARELRTLLARACERGCTREVEAAIEAADRLLSLGNQLKARSDGAHSPTITVVSDGIKLSYRYLSLDSHVGVVYCAAELYRDGVQLLEFDLVAYGDASDLNSRDARFPDGGRVFLGALYENPKLILTGSALDLAP
jgi:hypothetical protein